MRHEMLHKLTEICWESLKGRHHIENWDVDGKILLKYFLNLTGPKSSSTLQRFQFYLVQCRAQIDTLVYYVLCWFFPKLLPYNGCFWNSKFTDLLRNYFGPDLEFTIIICTAKVWTRIQGANCLYCLRIRNTSGLMWTQHWSAIKLKGNFWVVEARPGSQGVKGMRERDTCDGLHNISPVQIRICLQIKPGHDKVMQTAETSGVMSCLTLWLKKFPQ